jgi:hypothetical protein
MEYYESTCQACRHTWRWAGYKTGIGKTAAQIEHQRVAGGVCPKCGGEAKVDLDHTSADAKVLDEGMGALAQLIVKMVHNKAAKPPEPAEPPAPPPAVTAAPPERSTFFTADARERIVTLDTRERIVTLKAPPPKAKPDSPTPGERMLRAVLDLNDERDKLAKKVTVLEGELKTALASLSKARQELLVASRPGCLATARREDVWFWEGGEPPETLSSPVVMSAETFREILARGSSGEEA